MSDKVQITREELDKVGIDGLYTQDEVDKIEETYQKAMEGIRENKEVEMVFENLKDAGVEKDHWKETLDFMIQNKMENKPEDVKRAAVKLGYLQAVDMDGVNKRNDLRGKISEYLDQQEKPDDKQVHTPSWSTPDEKLKVHKTHPFWQDKEEDPMRAKLKNSFYQEGGSE